MKLTDPKFDATFIGKIDGALFRELPSIEGAQGVLLFCPCGQGHHCMIPFANPRNAPALPERFGPVNRNGGHSRWQMSGSGLNDLTLTPSVDVGSGSCWHGYITNGEVT